jgi:GT2 family glycosyltransferase
MSQTPVVSIIIPTHNRRQLLMQNLSALSGQTYAATDFEVLVVADSCADDTAAFVRAYASQTPFRLRLLQHSAKSAAATRNLGASHAEGAIFLFLDDDVIAQPDFVRVHVEAQFEDSVVLGYSKPMLSRRPSWWQYDARRWWEDTFREMANPGHRFSYRNFFSGNVSMAASLFQRVNGFDMSFTGRLEDYELGVRLLKAGARFCYVPAAIGYHYDNTDLARWLRRIRQEGVADVQIGQRHPELRALMFGDLSEPPEWTLATIRRIAFAFPALGDMLERRMLGATAGNKSCGPFESTTIGVGLQRRSEPVVH